MNEYERLKAQKDAIVKAEHDKIFAEGYRAGMERAIQECDARAKSGKLTFNENHGFAVARNTLRAVLDEWEQPAPPLPLGTLASGDGAGA